MDELAIKPFFLLWFFVKVAASRKGFISEVLINKRFDCPLASRMVYTVKSQLQCTHRCLQNDMCELISYNTDQTSTRNCEILTQVNQCTDTLRRENWVAMIFQVRTTNAL